MNLSGSGRTLSPADFQSAADELGCELPLLLAVAEMESGGCGMLEDSRPRILFESHLFSRHTGHRYDASHPGISTPRWTRNYLGGKREYTRLEEAMALDERAALASASWGIFQILGSNYQSAGHDSVEGFVAANVDSEQGQLACFMDFIRSTRLLGPLQARDFDAFARGYNGPAYHTHGYHTRLAELYRRFAAGRHLTSAGVQEALAKCGFEVVRDGKAGNQTLAQVRHFQVSEGLEVNGKLDLATCSLLEARLAASQASSADQADVSEAVPVSQPDDPQSIPEEASRQAQAETAQSEKSFERRVSGYEQVFYSGPRPDNRMMLVLKGDQGIVGRLCFSTLGPLPDDYLDDEGNPVLNLPERLMGAVLQGLESEQSAVLSYREGKGGSLRLGQSDGA